MKIRLVGHASVIVETPAGGVWTDPWLRGKAFNDSWSLFPEPAWDPSWLDGVEYIWLSHEHPDHFHPPTLKSLPRAFKERAVVLFQQNNSDKMFRAFEAFGFKHFKALPHRRVVPLTDTTAAYCYQEGQMNSCLALISGGEVVFNVNDAEIRTSDCRLIVREIGQCDVVLNQFSVAGYSGQPDPERHLRTMATQILSNMADNHRDLGARITIPFASFVYFSSSDNAYVNRFGNTPGDVARYFAEHKLGLEVLYPGDVLDTKVEHDSRPALERFERAYASFDQLPYDPPKRVEFEAIAGAFGELCESLSDHFPSAVLRLLRPVVAQIPDLELTIEFSIAERRIGPVERTRTPHLIVNSQPLHFAFRFPFGVQTLGVSARFALCGGERNWQGHRILFALNNAELYLKPKHLLTPRTLGYLATRFRGGVGQLRRRLQTM